MSSHVNGRSSQCHSTRQALRLCLHCLGQVPLQPIKKHHRTDIYRPVDDKTNLESIKMKGSGRASPRVMPRCQLLCAASLTVPALGRQGMHGLEDGGRDIPSNRWWEHVGEQQLSFLVSRAQTSSENNYLEVFLAPVRWLSPFWCSSSCTVMIP